MNNRRRRSLLAMLLLMSCISFAPLTVSASESESETVRAVPALVVEGNTIYVDASADGAWNSLQGTVEFDPANEVTDYGYTKELLEAASEQGVIGVPLSNVTEEGKFIFAAAYTSGSGEGVLYEGHVFYITFADTSTPIDITVYDEYNYEMLTATVDGSAEAVTYAADEETLQKNEEQYQNALKEISQPDTNAGEDEKADTDNDTDADNRNGTDAEEDSPGSIVVIIVVILVVVLAVLAVLISKKQSADGESKEGMQEKNKDDAGK